MRVRLASIQHAIRRTVTMSLAIGAVASVGAFTPWTAAQAAPGSVSPNKVGALDCNGWSTIQASVKPTGICTDLHGSPQTGGRFYDNGWYIGHDEPDLRFLSSKPGSGNNVVWTEKLSTDPTALPTVQTPGSDISHMFELSVAPWFSMALCNPESYPLNPCTPNRDSNAPAPSCLGANPCTDFTGGGSSFLELQFYPPGYAPFVDNISCDNSHWCAALHINDLECTYGFASCNPGCVEPTNFAFIQLDGVPTGPPSPQLANLATSTPNAATLLMNPGDKLQVHIFDAPVPGGSGSALETVVQDLSTGQTGYMQASAQNGFMATSIKDCSGTPFNYEPEYLTAKYDNIVPWAALQTNISTEFEIGHFTACKSVSKPSTLTVGSFVDTYWNNCLGPYEMATSPDGANKAEVNDSPCYSAGDTHGGTAAPNEVTGCLDAFTQNGDLDFDGSPYWAEWPTSTSPNSFPSTFVQQQPRMANGQTYSQFQFQTDVALSESTCNGTTGCGVPPPNAPGAFYPYWTRAGCNWEFGNMAEGNTFGGAAQYGPNSFPTNGYPEFESQLYANNCG